MLDLKKALNTAGEIQKTIDLLVAGHAEIKKPEDIDQYRKEVLKHDRTIRTTQVGNVQKDKTVKQKLVPAVRIVINFAKKIVRVACAFEVGKPVTLLPSADNKLSQLVKLLWKVNRIDSAVQKLIYLQKSETQGALQFYINDITEKSLFVRIIGFMAEKLGIASQAKEIKVKVLDNVSGVMSPYFDEFGDMKAFTWRYGSKIDGKDINNTQIWDETFCYVLNDQTGSIALVNQLPHGFDRIPIVYVSQDEPEWFDAREMIDRVEVALSKLGASNDYSGHPMLKIFGTVTNAPDKDEDGKAWLIPITKDDDGKEIKGDVELLTNEGASESNKLELDKLEDFIYSITSTPNLSFDNVKGIGSVSGIALKLMFMDAMIKASLNEGENRTMIERIINIFISGIVNTTNTALVTEAKTLYYDVQFNSIMPDDLKEATDITTAAVNAGIMSKRTAVKYLGMNEDTDAELELIASEAATIK